MSSTATVELADVTKQGLLIFCERQKIPVVTDAYKVTYLLTNPEDEETFRRQRWLPGDRRVWLSGESSHLSYDSDYREQLQPFLRRFRHPEDPSRMNDELLLCDGLARYQAAGLAASLVQVGNELVLDVQLNSGDSNEVELQGVQLG